MYSTFHTNIKISRVLGKSAFLFDLYNAFMSGPFELRSCDTVLKGAVITSYNLDIFALEPTSKIGYNLVISLMTCGSPIKLLDKVREDGFMFMEFSGGGKAIFRLSGLTFEYTQNNSSALDSSTACFSETVDAKADCSYIIFNQSKAPFSEPDGTEGYNGA